MPNGGTSPMPSKCQVKCQNAATRAGPGPPLLARTNRSWLAIFAKNFWFEHETFATSTGSRHLREPCPGLRPRRMGLYPNWRLFTPSTYCDTLEQNGPHMLCGLSWLRNRISLRISLLHQYREANADNRYVMMRHHHETAIKHDNVDTHHSIALTNAWSHMLRKHWDASCASIIDSRCKFGQTYFWVQLFAPFLMALTDQTGPGPLSHYRTGRRIALSHRQNRTCDYAYVHPSH